MKHLNIDDISTTNASQHFYNLQQSDQLWEIPIIGSPYGVLNSGDTHFLPVQIAAPIDSLVQLDQILSEQSIPEPETPIDSSPITKPINYLGNRVTRKIPHSCYGTLTLLILELGNQQVDKANTISGTVHIQVRIQRGLINMKLIDSNANKADTNILSQRRSLPFGKRLLARD